MCGIVYLVDQEKELGSPQDLQDVFSRDVTDYAADGYEAAGISMNSCLCQVDTERYLTDAGATFDAPDEWDDIYVTAMPATN